MSYCQKCGTQIENVNSKFCFNCGAQLEFSGPSNKPTSKKKRVKIDIKRMGVLVLVVLTLTSLFLFFPFSDPRSKAVLADCTDLLGAKTNVILSDNDYSIEKIFGMIVAKKETDNVFGVAGENVIFLTDEDKYIEIVTWQSDEDVILTKSEINKFVRSMKRIYGKCETSENDDDETIYLWNKKEFSVMLKINTEETYITWVDA